MEGIVTSNFIRLSPKKNCIGVTLDGAEDLIVYGRIGIKGQYFGVVGKAVQ